MAETVDLKVRVKIVLSQEHFSGPYHSGADTNYELNHPVRIVAHSGNLAWVQDRDRAGNQDQEHLPGHGDVVMDGDGNCALKSGGRDALIFEGFTKPPTNRKGVARYKWKQGQNQQTKNSTITYKDVGTWEIVQDKSDAPAPRYLTTGWKFNTSAGRSAGILVAEGGSGTFTLTDPYGVNKKFAFIGGGPSADIGKVLKIIKALKDLVWVEKSVKGLTSVGYGTSTEEMFSTGIVIKNVARVGLKDLVATDFLGTCFWLDAGIGAFNRGRGLMFLFTNLDTVFNIPTYTSLIPMYGQVKAPLQIGAGACVGSISPG